MNFGESLVYWYLRLNGFIPMVNYVLHEPDIRTGQNADTDILAVRFPHVYEDVGGHSKDWDKERFDKWDLGFREKIVCVVCEVKTGKYKKSTVNQAFGKKRMEYVISRLGVIPHRNVPEVVAKLLETPIRKLTQEGLVLAKLLIDVPELRPTENEEQKLELTPCLRMSLKEACDFIQNRMTNYKEQKIVSRMFFPGDLIQYLAWSAGVPLYLDESDVS